MQIKAFVAVLLLVDSGGGLFVIAAGDRFGEEPKPDRGLHPSEGVEEQAAATKLAQDGISVDEILRLKGELDKTTDADEAQQRLEDEMTKFRALDNDSKTELVDELLRRWRAKADSTLKRQIGEALRECAALRERDDDLSVIVEVATDGEYASKQIAIPTSTRTVSLAEVQIFDPEKNAYGEQYSWVIRRLTSDRVELWLPHKGWLFDGTGKNIATALPPRKDGSGREWYGAFLADGRWATTDLWEMDCVLYLFGRDGRKQKEISILDNSPPEQRAAKETRTNSVVPRRPQRKGVCCWRGR